MKYFLRSSIRGLLASLVIAVIGNQRADGATRVLVWDEQQPAQKQIYTNYLGNEIARHLQSIPGLDVQSARLDDADQGLSKAALDACDVLIWWGHQRHGEIAEEKAKEIVQRIRSGHLSLIALHSAHWSQPFVEAMRARARADALDGLSAVERASAKIMETNLFKSFRTPPTYDTKLSPSALYRKPATGPVEVHLTLPNCCFPAYRADGKPSQIRILLADHPVARGVPKEFTIAQTEMYDEPFHVPPPDEVILEERWAGGEWFRSGAVWKIGKGKVFYFRPGHETFPVYKNENVLHLLANAVVWLKSSQP